MNNFANDHPNILDLPDEVLFIILKKLNAIDALHSLVPVNRRSDRLVVDPLYTRHLDLTDTMVINSLRNETSSIDKEVLSRICQKILPRIHPHIHELIVEEHSMKEALLAGNYPRLYSLSLVNVREITLYQYLTGDSILRDLLTKQITHLNMDIRRREGAGNNRISSTLMKLKITVESFDDCLLLLDGRLGCLSTLIIHVKQIVKTVGMRGESKYFSYWLSSSRKLRKLKRFSFTTFDYTWLYDSLIVPLLCRMINLEELNLFVTVMRFRWTYLDGIEFYNQFLIHMSQLNKFTFNIKTEASNANPERKLPSNKDIQCSFIGRYYQQVASDTYVSSKKTVGECHIYSLPFDFEYFFHLNNSFQGGTFYEVRYLTMYKKDRLQSRLIQVISQHFPFLEFLYINNRYRPENKKHSCELITFPYLTYLNLHIAHADYVKVFLLRKKTHLPRLLNLQMECRSLERITKNFTKDGAHFNFKTMRKLDVGQPLVRPDNFHEYFPLL